MDINITDLAVLVVFLLVAYFSTITYFILRLADIRDLIVEHGEHIPEVKQKIIKLGTLSVAAAFTVVMVMLTLFIIMLKF